MCKKIPFSFSLHDLKYFIILLFLDQKGGFDLSAAACCGSFFILVIINRV